MSREYRKIDFSRSFSAPDTMARWLSDSRRIVLVLGNALKVLDTETLEMRDVGDTPNGVFALADVTRDDRQVLLIRRSINDDIWMLALESQREP